MLLQNPGPPIPNTDGGFSLSWTDLPPAADVRIAPASTHSLEHVTAGTVIAMASHVVTLPYRRDVTTRTRGVVDGRILNVLSVLDPEERHIDLILVCAEIVL